MSCNHHNHANRIQNFKSIINTVGHTSPSFLYLPHSCFIKNWHRLNCTTNVPPYKTSTKKFSLEIFLHPAQRVSQPHLPHRLQQIFRVLTISIGPCKNKQKRLLSSHKMKTTAFFITYFTDDKLCGTLFPDCTCRHIYVCHIRYTIYDGPLHQIFVPSPHIIPAAYMDCSAAPCPCWWQGRVPDIPLFRQAHRTAPHLQNE